MLSLDNQEPAKLASERGFSLGTPLPAIDSSIFSKADEAAEKTLSAEEAQMIHNSVSYHQFGMINCTSAIHRERV